MWCPAFGGLVVGRGGLIFPQALGVAYDVIGALLGGDASLSLIGGVLLVESVIWVVAPGCGTSGGVPALIRELPGCCMWILRAGSGCRG